MLQCTAVKEVNIVPRETPSSSADPGPEYPSRRLSSVLSLLSLVSCGVVLLILASGMSFSSTSVSQANLSLPLHYDVHQVRHAPLPERYPVGSFGGPSYSDIGAHGTVSVSRGDDDRHAHNLDSPTVRVEIDIRPGSDSSCVNLESREVVPVVVFTTGDFNASTVIPAAVRFASASPIRWTMADAGEDGDRDLLLHFKTQELGLQASSTDGLLIGRTRDGLPIQGVDLVNVVP